MNTNRMLIGMMLSLPALASAQWKGEGELGLSVATGNTETQNLAARLGLEREIDRWKHRGTFEMLQSETDGTTTAERYVLAAKSDYKLGETLYTFGALRHEQDEFGGFEQQTTISAGLGDRIIDDTQTSLDVSAGLGLRSVKLRPGGETEDDTIVRLGASFKHQFNANVAFSEELLIEAGGDNTFIDSVTGLTAKIDQNLAAKLSYQIKHNTDVAAGQEDTDTLTTASLVYSF